VLDLDGTVLAANGAATRLLSRSVNEVVGRKAWDFAPGAEHIWSEVIAAARATDSHGEIAIATPEGPRTIHYVVSVRAHEQRELVLLFAVEVRAPDDVRAQRLESLGLVAGGIAHDFNNQLVSVLAEASSVRDEAGLSGPVQESLRRIEAAAQRMALLTRQLLSYAGRGRFVSELVDPDALLLEMREQLQQSVRSDADLVINPSVAPAAIYADRSLLREVVLNLAVNASESLAMRGGKIRISSVVAPRDASRHWWRLEVSDDGIGMDSRTVARIFDPFFTTKSDRHGLGLSGVHGIVRGLVGEIAVDSKPNTGTTFVVRIPVVSGTEVKAKDMPPPLAQARTLAGVQVLVADDEPSVRSTIRRLLERRGASVQVAADGGEAASRLREGNFALVLLDVMMPKLTGYQLLPIARQTQPKARVLLMSGYADAARGRRGEDEPDLFLEKPFTAKQMDAAIDALLGRGLNAR